MSARRGLCLVLSVWTSVPTVEGECVLETRMTHLIVNSNHGCSHCVESYGITFICITIPVKGPILTWVSFKSAVVAAVVW